MSNQQALGQGTSLLSGSQKWNGGVYAPNGKVYMIPKRSATIAVVDTSSTPYSLSNIGHLPSLGLTQLNHYQGGAITPQGIIYCVPHGEDTILKINTNTDEVSTFGDVSAYKTFGDPSWDGAVYAPNGKVYAAPFKSNVVIEITPSDDSIRYIETGFGGNGYFTGFHYSIPTGNLYSLPGYNGVPTISYDMLEFDFKNETFSTHNVFPVAYTSHGAIDEKGDLYAMPYWNTLPNLCKINTSTKNPSLLSVIGGNERGTGMIYAPDGNMYFTPLKSPLPNIIVTNTLTDATSILPLDPSLPGLSTYNWVGCVLTGDGKVVGCPGSGGWIIVYDLIDKPNDKNWMLSPLFNHF